eukprot:TRINITY_DN31208_c0_g3_i5.p3 TRINITY_DN31208_c0_g3~~TRINITY_DN31208_c0_g3_i5.p3  ORF type:complete len:239 (-),score=55.48 TRINITY_DN31208_c0_g3_i5:732-1448(-)
MAPTLGTNGGSSSSGSNMFGLSEAPAKRGRQSESHKTVPVPDEEEGDVQELLAGLAIIQANHVNVLKGAVVDTYIIPTKEAIVQAGLTSTKEFYAEVNVMAKENKHKAGPPYIRVFTKLGEHVHCQLPEGHKDRIAIEYFMQKIKDIQNVEHRMDAMKEGVRQCKLTLCRDKEKAKLEVIVVDKANLWCEKPGAEACWLAMQRYLAGTCSAVKKTGPAPVGNRERKLMSIYGQKVKTE